MHLALVAALFLLFLVFIQLQYKLELRVASTKLGRPIICIQWKLKGHLEINDPGTILSYIYICDSDINIALITKMNTCLMTYFDFSWCCCDWRGGAQLENSCNFFWWPKSFPCQWCWKTFSSNTCLFSSSIMYLLTKITHTRCCLLVMSEFEAKTIWDYISVLNTTKLFCNYISISICIVAVLIVVWNRKVSYLLPWAIWSWTTLDLAVLDCNTCM